jgi:hypothetical protein
MRKTPPFEVVFDELVPDHLDAIENKYLALIRNTIERELRYGPNVETRNRKPLSEPTAFGATWEFRFGPNNRFGAFYDIHLPEMQLVILAIGVKIRNELWIGRERWRI